MIVFSQELATEADRPLARDRQKGGNSAMTGPRPPEPDQLVSVRAVVKLHEAGMSTAVGLPSNKMHRFNF